MEENEPAEVHVKASLDSESRVLSDKRISTNEIKYLELEEKLSCCGKPLQFNVLNLRDSPRTFSGWPVRSNFQA